jgi:hypothetical protein
MIGGAKCSVFCNEISVRSVVAGGGGGTGRATSTITAAISVSNL